MRRGWWAQVLNKYGLIASEGETFNANGKIVTIDLENVTKRNKT
jgi:hypothetical protein